MILTLETLALAVAMAAAAGLVGAFAVMRRMALASDALSHVALPGIGLAVILRLHPAAGAAAALGAGSAPHLVRSSTGRGWPPRR